MIEIYQNEEQREDEGQEEQENSRRRISRPKLKYSPIPEINKRRFLKKHQSKHKLNVRRINSGSGQMTTFTDSSISAMSTRENSYVEELAGRDVMSQRELHQQLMNIKSEEFILPFYGIKRILENSSSPQITPKKKNEMLIEQKFSNISVSYTNHIPPSMAGKERTVQAEISDQNIQINTTPDIAMPVKKHTVQSTLKRMRRPPKKSGEFIYTEVKKQSKFLNRVPIKLSRSIVNRKKRQLLLAQKTVQPKLSTIPSQNNHTGETSNDLGEPAPLVEPSMSEETKGAETMKGISKPNLEMKNEIPPVEKARLKLKLKLPFRSAVQATMRRMRRPPQNSEEYIFPPLKKQRQFVVQKDPLKFRKAIINRKKQQQLIERNMGFSYIPKHIPLDRARQHASNVQSIASQSINMPSQNKPKQRRTVMKKVRSIPSSIRPQAEHSNEQIQQVPFIEEVERPPQPKIPQVPSVEMDFFDRMNHRKQLNPFSIGIKKFENFADDYFYREILISYSPSNAVEVKDEDEEIDFMEISSSEAECKDDEKMLKNPAAEFAIAIQKQMENSKEEYSPVDLEQPESDFESIIKERMKGLNSDIRQFLDILYKFILDQRYVDTVTQGLIGGASMFHSLTMKNANRLRESLKLYNKVNQNLIVAAHCWLLKNLPVDFIASYLNLLRFVKAAGSSLSDHIIDHSDEKCITKANRYIKDYIQQKIYEPPMNANYKPIDYGPIPNVSLVLVYPQITAGMNKHIIRAHETLFRLLLPLVVCCVEKVELNFDVDGPITVEECAWMCIHLIRQKVYEIVKRRPNDHIFLAGWGTTCCLNHKVVTRVPGVSGILNFAFSTETAVGSRGSIDDEICLTYPSTLFVVGEDAFNVNMKALQRMRRNMITDTGLIVIGDANHNLLVSQTRLSIERITQFVIQRTIVEYTVQFVKQVITDLGPRRDCRELLKPVVLPNMYEVDINLLKQPTTTKPKKLTTAAGKKADEVERRPLLGQQQQQLTSSAAFAYGKMTGHGQSSRPTQLAFHLPSGLQPVIPTSSSRIGNYHASRTAFGGLLKTTKAATTNTVDISMGVGIKIPSPETLNSQVFKAATTTKMTTMAPLSTSTVLQDTLREEEEAAAALKF